MHRVVGRDRWQQELETTAEFLALEGFGARVRYLEEHPEAMPIGGYRFSKVVMNQWVANTAVDYGPRGIASTASTRGRPPRR